MGRIGRWLLVAAVVTAKPDTVKFLQPRCCFTTAGPYGADVQVQVRVEPAEANRHLVIEWCGGKTVRQLAGADAEAVQPPERPLTVRVYDGRCQFVASVFDGQGKQVGRADLTLKVNGDR